MSEELYFNNELRKCLNAAGISDCGENDAWNYWYQRVHKAHDQAVDRVTEAQRAENDELRIEAERLCDENERLEAENSMLRELENIRMTQVEHCESLTKDIEKLKEENAKLRKLAREAYDTARGLALNDPLADVSWLADRMRELGVEAE